MDVGEKLQALGLALPELSVGSVATTHVVGAVHIGSLVFVSGRTPFKDGKFVYVGKVGREFDTADGYEAAKLTILNSLATLKQEIGDLDHLKRVVKLLGIVNCTPEFTELPQVINGASDVLVELFGERGRHARSALGAASLPHGQAVEIEMIVEVE